MHFSRAAIASSLVLLISGPAAADDFLIRIHSGPDSPTKAALGSLVALPAMNEGQDVNLFLAGDGASLITDDALSTVEGLGTGKLQDHLAALTEGEAQIHISGSP